MIARTKALIARFDRLPADSPLPADAYRYQVKAGHGNHGAGHDRRKQAHQAADDERHQHGDQARDDDGSKHPLKSYIGIVDHHQHGRYGRKRDPHHQWQSYAELPDADRLDEGRHSANEQIGADQECNLIRRQLGGRTDQNRDGDGAGIHDQHMLQPEYEQFPRNYDLIYSRHLLLQGSSSVLITHMPPPYRGFQPAWINPGRLFLSLFIVTREKINASYFFISDSIFL